MMIMEICWWQRVKNQKCRNKFICSYTSDLWFIIWFFCCHCCYCYCCCYYHSFIYWYIVNNPLFYFWFTHICMHMCMGVCVVSVYVHAYIHIHLYIHITVFCFLFWWSWWSGRCNITFLHFLLPVAFWIMFFLILSVCSSWF